MKKLLPLRSQAHMQACIELARKGRGLVSPNPLVGALLVKHGRIIGKGYHQKYGSAHAEVNAIRSARTSVRGATLYVNLEPCSHYGKTSPCTDLIISSKIRNVIIGMKDPNPLVAGKGIRRLRSAGIQCTVGVCEEECKSLNEFFIKFIAKKIPFVALKVAQTLDGKIAGHEGRTSWITSPQSRRHVHLLRSCYDAVLIGAGTVNADNPKLTVRLTKGRNPMRVVIDGRLTLDPQAKIFHSNKSHKTILYTSKEFAGRGKKKLMVLLRQGVQVISLRGTKEGKLQLRDILHSLGSLNIASVLVEGGSQVFSSFMSERLVDKMFIFIAPKVFGKGLDAFTYDQYAANKKEIVFAKQSYRMIGGDLLLEATLTT